MSFKLKINIDQTSLEKNKLPNQSTLDNSNNNDKLINNLEASFKLNNLTLNSNMEPETVPFKLPQSTSSSSIALLNAKSKALKNLKRIEAGSENSVKSNSHYLIENLNSNNIPLEGSTTKINDETNHEDMSFLSETNFFKQSNFLTETKINDAQKLKRNNAVDIFKDMNDSEQFSSKFYSDVGKDNHMVLDSPNKFDMFTDDMNGVVDNISAEDQEIKSVYSDPDYVLVEPDVINKIPSSKGKHKAMKGFAIFGRYPAYVYFLFHLILYKVHIFIPSS